MEVILLAVPTGCRAGVAPLVGRAPTQNERLGSDTAGCGAAVVPGCCLPTGLWSWDLGGPRGGAYSLVGEAGPGAGASPLVGGAGSMPLAAGPWGSWG